MAVLSAETFGPSAFPRSVSPPLSRGNSVGGDCLAPGLQPQSSRLGGLAQPSRSTARSLSPEASARYFAANSSMASSIDVPCTLPMATVGVDTTGKGRADFVYVGLDMNRDGIPDALQSSSMPRMIQSSTTAPAMTFRTREATPEPLLREMATSLPSAPATVLRSADAMCRSPASDGLQSSGLAAQLMSSVSAAPLLASRAREAIVLPPEAVPKSPDMSRLDGPLQALVNDAISAQFLRLKDAMAQEVERNLQILSQKMAVSEDLLQRFEAERVSKQSAVAMLRTDLDQQRAQINELVRSRLSTNEEVAARVENLRQEFEVVQSQHRNALAGNAATSESQQRVEKAVFDMRTELGALNVENQQRRNALAQMDMDSKDFQRKIMDQGRDREKLQGQQFNDIVDQLSTFSQRQSQLERVLLEVRQEVQTNAEEIEKVNGTHRIHQDKFKQHVELLEEHEQIHQTLITNIKDLKRETAVAGEEAISDLRRRLEAGIAEKGREQMLSAEFGAKLQMSVERLEGRVKQLEDIPSDHHKELAKTVHAESAARIELTQIIDAYRNAHTKSSGDIGVLQERVALLETVQLEDRGVRERTMDQMEVNLQELMNLCASEREARLRSDTDSARRVEEIAELQRQFHVESAARVDMAQNIEAFRTASLSTSSDIRRDLDTVSDNCTTLRQYLDNYSQDITNMVKDEAAARSELGRTLEKVCDELPREVQASINPRFQSLESNIQSLESNMDDVKQMLAQEEATAEALRVETINTRTELRAELDVLSDKQAQLEAVMQESEASIARATEIVDQKLGIETQRLHKKIDDAQEQRDKLLCTLDESLRGLVQGKLDRGMKALEAASADLQVEQSKRSDQASSLQADLQVLRMQLSQIEDSGYQRDQRVENTLSSFRTEVEMARNEAELMKNQVHKSVVEVTYPAIENLKDSVSQDLTFIRADVAKTTQSVRLDGDDLQSGMKVMQEKLKSLETAHSEDKGWRQQAVQDLEGILGEMKHISPAQASSRTLPTLASALRQSRAEMD